MSDADEQRKDEPRRLPPVEPLRESHGHLSEIKLAIAQVRQGRTYTEKVEAVHRLIGLSYDDMSDEIRGYVDKKLADLAPFSYALNQVLTKDSLVVIEIRLGAQNFVVDRIPPDKLEVTLGILQESYSRTQFESTLAMMFGRVVSDLARRGIIPFESEKFLLGLPGEVEVESGPSTEPSERDGILRSTDSTRNPQDDSAVDEFDDGLEGLRADDDV